MKAYVLHGSGDIRLEKAEIPSPKEGEVLVRVYAAGIDSWDIAQIYGKGTGSYPVIPGHDFSGKVEAIGRNVNSGWLNQRVAICPTYPCNICAMCRKGKPELCVNYGYIGSDKNGGFAEFAVIKESNLLRLPQSVSYEEAVMIEPMAVALHAMRKAHPVPDDKLFVSGMDIIGILLLMFLKGFGMEHVYAIGWGESYKQTMKKIEFPLKNCCNAERENLEKWVNERTEGKGADVFYEHSGKKETLSQIINVMNFGGRVCLMGKPCVDMKLGKMPYKKIQKKQLVLMGCWGSCFNGTIADDWHCALEMVERKKVDLEKLTFKKYVMDDFIQGFRFIKDKDEGCMKIMKL